METIYDNDYKDLNESDEEFDKKPDIITIPKEVSDNLEKDNDYLLVGIHGNGAAYLKSNLIVEMTNNHKFKYMAGKKDNNKPLKHVADLYQIKFKNINHLVIVARDQLTDDSYKSIFDHIKETFTFKRAVTFESTHKSNFLTIIGEQYELLYCLKNNRQNQSNQLIRVPILPSPNRIIGFSAYIMTKCEQLDIPCVSYFSINEHYEVSLLSIQPFTALEVTYEFFRGKLSEDYIKNNGINLSKSVFYAENSHRSDYFS